MLFFNLALSSLAAQLKLVPLLQMFILIIIFSILFVIVLKNAYKINCDDFLFILLNNLCIFRISSYAIYLVYNSEGINLNLRSIILYFIAIISGIVVGTGLSGILMCFAIEATSLLKSLSRSQ